MKWGKGRRAKAGREPWLSARRLTGFSIGGIFLLVGIGAYIWIAATESAAQSWPITAGQVIETKVERVAGRGGSSSYAPVIFYRYEAGGTVYRGRKIQLTDHPNFDTPDDAAAYAAQFPPGSEVAVHYDPHNPERAALYITSNRAITYVFTAMGLVFVLWGLVRR